MNKFIIIFAAITLSNLVFAQTKNLNPQTGSTNGNIQRPVENINVGTRDTRPSPGSFDDREPVRNNSNGGSFSTQQGGGSINSTTTTIQSQQTYYYNNTSPFQSQSNFNTNYQPYSSYTFDNDGYGSSVFIINDDGSKTRIDGGSNSFSSTEDSRVIKERIENHTVHFSGLIMSDVFLQSHTSKAYVYDMYSDFLTPGKYRRIGDVLGNSVRYTFDGIAVAPNTRMIIYSGTDFSGSILVDVTGPAIINNSKWQNDDRYEPANYKFFIPDLQSVFPMAVRQWSVNNMHNWQNGSIEIIETK